MGDAMELTVIAFVLPVLAVEWNVPQATADSLASIMFVGMLVGALLWGIFTDHYGRRAGWPSGAQRFARIRSRRASARNRLAHT